MGILAHEKRTVDVLHAAVLANGLSDGQDVCFGECAFERRSPVAAGSKADHLGRIAQVRMAFEIQAIQLIEIDEHLFRGGLACQRRNTGLHFCFGRHGTLLRGNGVHVLRKNI